MVVGNPNLMMKVNLTKKLSLMKLSDLKMCLLKSLSGSFLRGFHQVYSLMMMAAKVLEKC